MEKALEIFFTQSSIVIFMGVVIYFLWLDRNKERKENLRLNEYILMREREIASDRMDEQKEIIEAMNEVATSLTNHNKLTEYEQHRKKA
jgi:hypothetical protein